METKHWAFHILGVNPDLDLFASRINTQLSSYVSFKPDPRAKAVDGKRTLWTGMIQDFMLFHHFASFLKCCKKFAETEQKVS